MRIATTKCNQFGHPEVVLESDESQVPDVYLKNVVETLETMVASGSVFSPEQLFQIGWGVTLVKSAGNMLSLVEPDMEAFPFKWTKGITNTLRQMMVQLFMLDSVGLREQMDAPSFCESLVVCNHYNESNFFMSRSEGSGGTDSGWFIGCLNDDHSHDDEGNLKCVSVYEAFLNQRGVQGFASFPVGSMIVVEPGNQIRVYNEDVELDIVSGSFLDEWFKQQ